MHAMLSNDYNRKVSCMAAGAPAAFCRTSRRGFASPQSARSSYDLHLCLKLFTSLGAFWQADIIKICPKVLDLMTNKHGERLNQVHNLLGGDKTSCLLHNIAR